MNETTIGLTDDELLAQERERIKQAAFLHLTAVGFSSEEITHLSSWRENVDARAGKQIQNFVKGLKGYLTQGRLLTISGCSGSGKSTMAAAIANQILMQELRQGDVSEALRIVRVLTAHDIIEQAGQNEIASNVFALIVDGMRRPGSEIRRAAFENVILKRGNRPTAFIVNTDDFALAEMGSVYPSLKSRFAKNLMVSTKPQDYRARQQMQFMKDLNNE